MRTRADDSASTAMSMKPRSSEPKSPMLRDRVAQALAFLGLVAALVGGLGPSERVRTTYSWPPEALPNAQPERVWYTPLLLIRHRPESISADLPCAASPTLAAVGKSATVLATARYPVRAGALWVTQTDRRLVIAVGERTLGSLPLASSALDDGECTRRLTIVGGGWSVGGESDDGASLAGSVAEMPVVYGLFSELDLRSDARPSVDVTTAVHATRTTTSQGVAWAIAAVAIVTALLLLIARRGPAWPAIGKTARAATMAAHPVDAAVGSTLLVWWVLSPAFGDDGWVAAREEMFASSRGFSHYYSAFGTNLPLDYWVEWLQHWLVQSTSALVVARLPALACLAITWVLCRWVAGRVLAVSGGASNVALWALAATFLAGALGWGMTLRPEPTTALLVTAVLACMARFVERGTTTPLAAAAVLVPLAITAHPAGIVALAPVLAGSGRLFEFVRTRPAVASTIVSTTVASFAVLALIGSDLEQRRADAQATAAYGDTVAWRYELIRYTSLADAFWGTPLRRSSVTVMALAVLAFALWGRRSRHGLLGFPASALVLALALLVATPSKQPWHFGALMGLAAVAMSCETARLRQRADATRRLEVQPFVVLACLVLVIAWSWAPRHPWALDDLQTLDWTPEFERWVDLPTLACCLPFALLAALGSSEIVRGRRHLLPGTPWHVITWSAPLLIFPLVAFTVAVLAIDALRTDSWTLTRQNLGTFQGSTGCGVADDLRVAIPASAQPLSVAGAGAGVARSQPAWVPPPPAPGIPRFALGPAPQGRASSPWFAVGSRSFGIFVAGAPGAAELELEWGRLRRDRVDNLHTDPLSTNVNQGTENVVPQWRLLAAEELPLRPRDADMARITLRSAIVPGPAVAVTAPVTYERERLGPRISDPSSLTFVTPFVLPYFPCARLPRLRDGVVDVPNHVVLTGDSTLARHWDGTSPFAGVPNLFPLRRLPLADSTHARRGVFAVFAVDRRIPGAVEALPSKTSST